MLFEVKDKETMQREIERFCRFLAQNQVPDERVFDSRLVVSELVGNVLCHAQSTARFHGEVKDGFVEVCVHSDKLFVPPKTSRCAGVYEEHGRGLFLVDSVCAERTVTDEGAIRVRIRIGE
ncbi:MAG: hypothetical protein IJX88_00365 [Clostridia bacterium]|nr:hypothetical protein [Clostridia bacterium]